ncbi:MAG: aminoglycoside phosphotransferase family protein [Verrucomicrobiota bacterium]
MTHVLEASLPNADSMRRQLLTDGYINDPEAEITALTGGVSSDIYRVNDGERVFVIKRALEKLRVKDDWYADISRNRFELAYLQCVAGFLPDAVPDVLFSNAERGYFAMEFLGEDFSNWKELLLAGVCEIHHASIAGKMLATIHRQTWGDKKVQANFESKENFHQLRIEPYLLTTAERHPELSTCIRAEAQRLHQTQLCLVHGDYSPKNLMLSSGHFVILDCEVAWFGDPVFDIAFLLNHLLLKSLHLDKNRTSCIELTHAAWMAYCDELGETLISSAVAPFLHILLPMLMLARVDGKSPVEYLADEQKKQTLRKFAYQVLRETPKDVTELFDKWQKNLEQP